MKQFSLHTCNALKHALNLQLDAIGKLPSVPHEQISSRIRLIQTRHTDIQTHLISVVLKTRCLIVLWVHEFVDARLALEGKILSINRRFEKLGWITTERQCWPGIAETYAWLLLLVIRLQRESRHVLKQKELWTTDTPPLRRVGKSIHSRGDWRRYTHSTLMYYLRRKSWYESIR